MRDAINKNISARALHCIYTILFTLYIGRKLNRDRLLNSRWLHRIICDSIAYMYEYLRTPIRFSLTLCMHDALFNINVYALCEGEYCLLWGYLDRKKNTFFLEILYLFFLEFIIEAFCIQLVVNVNSLETILFYASRLRDILFTCAHIHMANSLDAYVYHNMETGRGIKLKKVP